MDERLCSRHASLTPYSALWPLSRTPPPVLPLSSLPLSCLPLVVHLFLLYLQHRSIFLNKSIEFINKQIIHNTIHNWAWALGTRRRRRGRGMCGRGPCLNCAAYAYLATMSSSSSLSLSVIVTGVSNRLTTSNRIYFDLFIHMLPPPPLSLSSPLSVSLSSLTARAKSAKASQQRLSKRRPYCHMPYSVWQAGAVAFYMKCLA